MRNIPQIWQDFLLTIVLFFLYFLSTFLGFCTFLVDKLYFHSQEKGHLCLSGNLEIDSLIPTFCCSFGHNSCVFVDLHVHTHFTDYLCDRPLQKVGRWKCLCWSTSAVVCLPEEGVPDSPQTHAWFCWKNLFPLLNQNLHEEGGT